MLNNLKQFPYLKKSSSFFYDLSCRLTETVNHEEYNIDGNLLPYCSKEQITDLFSRWSIKSFKQLDRYSSLVSKLCQYQTTVLIDLMKNDLNELNPKDEKYFNYFDDKSQLLEIISKKSSKELLDFFLFYLNQLENHQRSFPSIVSNHQKYFFEKCPNEMIDLISLVATNRTGSNPFNRF